MHPVVLVLCKAHPETCFPQFLVANKSAEGGSPNSEAPKGGDHKGGSWKGGAPKVGHSWGSLAREVPVVLRKRVEWV